MPAGRPTKYRKEYCEQLIDHMAEGGTVESFAGSIRVNKTTIYEWVKKNEAFSNAKSVGLMLSFKWWLEQGKESLRLGKDEKFNNTVWVFCMKNIHGWRDNPEPTQDDTATQVLRFLLQPTPTGLPDKSK